MGLLSTAARTVADWVKLGYPESVAKRIVSGDLPMDRASRLKRAEEQGYLSPVVRGKTRLYHGTDGDYGNLEPSVHDEYPVLSVDTTPDPDYASGYAENRYGRRDEIGNPVVYPLLMRGRVSDEGDVMSLLSGIDEDAFYEMSPEEVTDYLAQNGVKSFNAFGGSDEVSVLDPSILRSPNAAFDPEYTGRNILGGVALPATAGLLALGQSEDADAGPLSKAAKIAALRAEANAARFGGDVDVSYRGDHVAPTAEYGAPLHNLTEMIPEDVYGPAGKRLYGIGNDAVDTEAFEVLNAVRGNPDAEVRMYRAVPSDAPDEIADGDWVTTSRGYAEMHGQNALDGDYKVLEESTPARRLQSEGYPYEFGYMKNGFADPRLLAGLAGTAGGASLATAAANKLAAAQAVKEQGDIRAPNSSLLHDVTMGARDVQRRLEGHPASLLYPEGLVDYLEQANREERPNWATRAWSLLDFL